MQNRTEIVRARWQLWAATFAIIASLGGLIIFQAANDDTSLPVTILPSRALLGIALGGMIVAFLLYAFDRERNLHRLADRLVEEQLAGERLAARLRYLSELSRERDMNAALLDASADPLAVLDGNGNIVRFNPAMDRLCGTPGGGAGRSLLEVVAFADAHGVALQAEDHPLTHTIADGVARSGYQLQLTQPDGTTRWVSATFSPILDETTAVAVLVSLRDIAEQKEQEAMHRDFVSMAAHELRSPLTAIKGFTQTMLTRNDRLTDEKRTRYLALVNDQSDRLARLVDDLMQVSRIDAQRIVLEPEAFDLRGLVDQLLEQFREKWAGRTIEVTLGSEDVPAVLADHHRVAEVLINLIDNAVKYSPADTPVHVTFNRVIDQVEVRVRDYGAGMTDDEQAQLFTKFARLPQAKAADIPGTGLGLYIVKGLIEAHGGRVWVESRPDEGSTFAFTIPVAPEQVRLVTEEAARG